MPLPHGEGKAGAETSAEMLAYQKRWFPVACPVVRQADLRYELMNAVPEHWIPFAPTHVPGQQRAIGLQRAVMLRAIDGDPLGPQKSARALACCARESTRHNPTSCLKRKSPCGRSRHPSVSTDARA